MLVRLSVHNYALIRELDLSLENGLTIITGETGAGKSILLGALSLILGSRADTSMLLDDKEKCIVEGTFHIKDYDLQDFFANNDLDYESFAVLRREINPAGKSRAFINDTPVNINLMRDLGARLIDIHSQHQTLMLNNNSFQLSIIDSFASASSLLNEYRSAYSAFKKIMQEYNELKEKSEKNRADLEYFQFQFAQLEDAKLKDGEQEVLEHEQELLNHAEEITLALTSSSDLFSGDGSSVLSMLGEIKTIMGRITSFIPDGENLISRLESACIELDDLANEIVKLQTRIEADPVRLKIVNARLDQLYSLIQKHRVTDLNGLLEKKGQIENNIKSIATTDGRFEELKAELDSSTMLLSSLSAKLTEKRGSVLPQVELKITETLRQLGMINARFKISMSRLSDFTASGVDNVDFLFSANRQTEPENLAKIASGGELSRVMLSLKSLLTKNNNLPTIIFDEIDSGVSGEVADKVGQILSGMGKYMQVVNITHLPQVASRGSKHYHVFKEDTGDSTITRIKLLSGDERIMEVARLLSGSEVTETAIKNARELLKAARN